MPLPLCSQHVAVSGFVARWGIGLRSRPTTRTTVPPTDESILGDV